MKGLKNVLLNFILIFLTTTNCCYSQLKTKHLIVIGVDGLSSWGLKKYPHKTLDSLMNDGSYTLSARAVMPTLSAPNWVSIITGEKPSVHGIKSNQWKTKSGDKVKVPTIFRKIKQNDSISQIAIFHQWKNFSELVEEEFVDSIYYSSREDLVLNTAKDYLIKYKPSFTFIHLDLVDSVGHHYGLRSNQYKKALERTDSLIGVLINSICRSDLKNEVTIMITSDHGFWGKHHGGFVKTERNIPWIVSGDGIKQGKVISSRVYTEDTALLIEYLFTISSLDKRRRWIDEILDSERN